MIARRSLSTMSSSKSIIQFKAIGRVQGVTFRSSAQKQATSLGLVGWCHNHPDSSVEGVAYGPTSQVDSFRKYLSRGPPGAKVEKVEYVQEVQDPEDHLIKQLCGSVNLQQFEVRRHGG